MENEGDFAHRRADLKAKLRAKMRDAREAGGGKSGMQPGNAKRAAEAAQNALMSIEDPTMFEIAQKAIKTGDTSDLLKTAMSALKSENDTRSHVAVEDDDEDEAPPPMFHVSTKKDVNEIVSEDEEAPPPIAP